MRLPIDTSGMGFIAAGAPEPVVDFDTRRPKTDPSGVALFQVAVMAMTDGTAQVISVKVPGEPKGVTAGAQLRLEGLVGVPWAMGDRSGIAFRAAKIETVRPEGRGSDSRAGS